MTSSFELDSNEEEASVMLDLLYDDHDDDAIEMVSDPEANQVVIVDTSEATVGGKVEVDSRIDLASVPEQRIAPAESKSQSGASSTESPSMGVASVHAISLFN